MSKKTRLIELETEAEYLNYLDAMQAREVEAARRLDAIEKKARGLGKAQQINFYMTPGLERGFAVDLVAEMMQPDGGIKTLRKPWKKIPSPA